MRRVGATAVACAALCIGVTGVASPAGAAGPPMDCGMVYGEFGLLSRPVHVVDQTVAAVNWNLGFQVHNMNCNYVIPLELTLGLQQQAGY